MSEVTITGNITDDPELRYTPNGVAVCSFRVAINRRYQDAGEWKDGEPAFVDVECWRQLAENVAESARKGGRLIVVGKFKLDTWEAQDGGKRSRLYVEAEEVGTSLRWATAPPTKVTPARETAGSSGRRG